MFQGGSVGDVVAFKHNVNPEFPVIFRDLDVASFTINNGANGGTNPRIYLFENTNLECDEVILQLVVNGTRVIIDGEECRV